MSGENKTESGEEKAERGEVQEEGTGLPGWDGAGEVRNGGERHDHRSVDQSGLVSQADEDERSAERPAPVVEQLDREVGEVEKIGIILWNEAKWKPEAAEALLRVLKESAHLPPIIMFDPPPSTNDFSQFLDVQAMDLRKISGAFGIDPRLIEDHPGYSTCKPEREQLMREFQAKVDASGYHLCSRMRRYLEPRRETITGRLRRVGYLPGFLRRHCDRIRRKRGRARRLDFRRHWKLPPTMAPSKFQTVPFATGEFEEDSLLPIAGEL